MLCYHCVYLLLIEHCLFILPLYCKVYIDRALECYDLSVPVLTSVQENLVPLVPLDV